MEIESENCYEMLGSDFDFYLDIWLVVCSKMNDDELNEFKFLAHKKTIPYHFYQIKTVSVVQTP